MIRKDSVEKQLECLLQRNIKFVVNEKVLKRGKLLMYRVKDFYIKFVIINNKNEQKYYEIPYPFAIHNVENNDVVFDYTFDTLADTNKMLGYRLRVISRKKKNKLYDAKMLITNDVD